MDDHVIPITNNSRFSDRTYMVFFMKVWGACIAEGFSTKEAREFAQMEWNDVVAELNEKRKIPDNLK